MKALKTSIAAASFLLFTFSFLAWPQNSPSPAKEPSVSEVAAGFTNYQQITKTAVYVSLEFAMYCRGVTQSEVDAARNKYGPHANAGIRVYMNPSAANAFATNASIYPVGAIIAKQKSFLGYTDKDGKFITQPDSGVGGMIKRPVGYDPEHGDWEYFYFEDPKKVENGRITTCVQCHSSAKAKDYVFGTWRDQK